MLDGHDFRLRMTPPPGSSAGDASECPQLHRRRAKGWGKPSALELPGHASEIVPLGAGPPFAPPMRTRSALSRFAWRHRIRRLLYRGAAPAGGPADGVAPHGNRLPEPLSERVRRPLCLRVADDDLLLPRCRNPKSGTRRAPTPPTPRGFSIHRKGPGAPLSHGSGLRPGMSADDEPPTHGPKT